MRCSKKASRLMGNSRPCVSRSGFTLLELMIVLAIIAVIAGMVVPRFLSSQQTANIKTTKSVILNTEKALELYAVEHNGQLPSQEGLKALVQPMDLDGKPMKAFMEELPKDAWGQPLFYEYPNTKSQNQNADRAAIWSAGPNGQNENGEGDDVKNWTTK